MTGPDSDRPDWLPRAWKVRAVMLSVVLGLLTLVLWSRLAETGGAWARALPLIFVVGLGVVLWADWVWLTRNHHRVNEWGLSKGKDARKKKK
ncbi:hypothetical protein [Neotabrizicola sp. VNH66]|uniref:hypothetical protein n=1 Tax=Neotabrizicola sp. VNH66 TaxID=3400918 RepID=UPI003C070435